MDLREQRAAAEEKEEEEQDASAASSSSSPLPLSRRVAADDRGLRRRVQWAAQQHASVAGDVEFLAADCRRPHRKLAHAVRSRSGWKWKQDKKRFSIYSRLHSTAPEAAADTADADGLGSPLSASTSLPSASADPGRASWSREWLAVGEVPGEVGGLASLLGASSEGAFNAAMKALYRSSFIYGSVVHSAKVGSRQRDAPPPLLVKTCSFVRPHLFAKKNDQLCFVEQLSPTASGGFTVAACSLPAHELTAGTASSELVNEIHPFSAFWSVEPSPEAAPGRARATLRVLYHVCLYISEPDPRGSRPEAAVSHSRHDIARMALLVKDAAARLEAALGAGKRRARLGTDPSVSLSIGGGSAASAAPGAGGVPGGHHNSHCIACTRHLFGLFQSVPWRRCELCAYHVCEACCSAMRLPSREVLRVCMRCSESREFREYSSALRGPPRRHSSPTPASGGSSSRGSDASGGVILEDPRVAGSRDG